MPSVLPSARNRAEHRHPDRLPSLAGRVAYSPDELADLLGASRAWVYLRIGDGTFPSVKIGRRRFIPAEAVDKLLTSGDAA